LSKGAVMIKNNWNHVNTITGSPAENDNYLRRQYINDEFWREIKKGNHILFAAPRRVGKTSIMIDLSKNCPAGYHCIFENIEACENQKQFFKRLFNILIKQFNSIEKAKKTFNGWLQKHKLDEINVINGTLKIGDKELDYKEKLLDLIKELPKTNSKFIVFLDEFPEVVSSIIKNEKSEIAIDTLHTLREIRQNSDFKNYILVLAGSIGLEHVVKDLDRIKLINDLKSISVTQLTDKDAVKLIKQLTKNATMQIDEEKTKYLLKKINHPIPYYIQLLVEESDRILFEKNQQKLTIGVINQAYENIIKVDKNFQDWEARLKGYLEEKVYKLSKDILTYCAHKNKISLLKVYDFSKKWKQKDDYMELVAMLQRDGYLIEENQSFRYVSPLLRDWWKRQHPKFELEED